MLNEYDELIELLPDDKSQATDLYFVREVLAGAGPLKVLDLGCGTGRTLDLFKRINASIEWIGVDIEDSVEARALTRSDLPLLRWDGIRIPIDDASIDMVYCHQVLEYVRWPHLVLKEVARVLKPEGWFIGSTSQFEPCVTGSLWNFKPLGFKLLVNASGLRLVQIRPGIDGLTLIARSFLGKPKCLSKYFGSESPLNSLIDAYHDPGGSAARKIALEKIRYCGQFSFKATTAAVATPLNGVPVITYHHHLPQKLKESSRFCEGSVTNTVESFAGQMAWLYENGYTTLTLAEFERYLEGQCCLNNSKKILITFDDGHLSLATYCYPILKQFQFTAIVFLITGKQPELSEDHFDPNVLQYVSRNEMISLGDVFEWAAHTHNLHSRDSNMVSRLVGGEVQEVIVDAAKNRELLQGTKHFCFPFGQYNQNVINALSTVGFKYFYTTEHGFAFPEPKNEIHLIRRLNMSPWLSLADFSMKINGAS